MIKITHPNIASNNKTYITARHNSGVGALTVLNNAGFAANQFVVIGTPGEEVTEVRRISSVSGSTTINITANTSFTHEKNTKITVIDYDQARVYKSSTIGGTYSLVGSAFNLTLDAEFTPFEDLTALDTDYFKVAYYNSYTTNQSGYSSPIPATGFPRYALVNIVDNFLEESQDKNSAFYTRDEVTRWVNDCKDDCFNKLAETNEKHYQGYIEIPLVSGTAEYDLPTTFKKEQMVNASYDGTNFVRAKKEELEDTDPDKNYDENTPVWYFNTYKIGLRPTPESSAGYLRVWYEAHPADLANDADELPRPMNRYLPMVYDYLWNRALRKDKKFTEARIYANEYSSKRDEMVEECNNLVLDENRRVLETEYDEDDF